MRGFKRLAFHIGLTLRKPEFKRSMIFTLFLGFSTLVSWQMEEHVDELRRKSVRTITLKEEMKRKED
jgi:hypothetical protein